MKDVETMITCDDVILYVNLHDCDRSVRVRQQRCKIVSAPSEADCACVYFCVCVQIEFGALATVYMGGSCSTVLLNLR